MTNALNILIVEDDDDHARMIERHLSRAGGPALALERATTLAATLARLAKPAPDVVLLDLRLPDATGEDTLMHVRNAAPTVPIVVLTALDDQGLAASVIRQGAQDFVCKAGLTSEQLMQAVRNAIERRRIEQVMRSQASELDETQRQLQRLVESVREYAIFTLAPDATVRTWNAGAERILGYTAQEMIGQPFAMFFRNIDVDSGKPMRALRAAALETRFQETGLLMRKDGRSFLADVLVTSVTSEDGAVSGYAIVMRDVTEREAANEALRQQGDELRRQAALLDLSSDAILVRDPDGRITFWSHGAERLYGWTRAEAIGQISHALLKTEYPVAPSVVHAAFARVGRWDGELSHARRDGTRINVASRWAKQSDGASYRVLETNTDITARLRAEHERLRLLEREKAARVEAERFYEEARNASRLKDEFLATVSHELRTPLNVILGNSELLLLYRMTPDESTQCLEAIRRNAKCQAQIVDDLLDASRIITGKLELAVGATDLAAVVRAAVETVRLAAETKGVRIVIDIGPERHVISANSTRLQQAAWNLLANAVKFTPRGGEVRVRLRNEGGVHSMAVEDTGEGIDPAFLPYVFDRFRQEDNTMTRRHGGLGIGLSIVRYVAEAHGGRVHASSPGKGEGAVFTFELPSADAMRSEVPRARDASPEVVPLVAAPVVPPAPPAPVLQRLKVLVVDDQEDVLALISTILKRAGADVAVAGTAFDALSARQAFDPDVLLCDIGMPDMDGLELIRRFRAACGEGGRTIPAAALTAYASEGDRQKALAAGYQLHIPKPVDSVKLVEAVRALADLGQKPSLPN